MSQFIRFTLINMTTSVDMLFPKNFQKYGKIHRTRLQTKSGANWNDKIRLSTLEEASFYDLYYNNISKRPSTQETLYRLFPQFRTTDTRLS